MHRRKIIIWLALVLLALLAFQVSISIAISKSQSQNITIALAVPYCDVPKFDKDLKATEIASKSMRRAVELYIDQVNRNDEIKGKRLNLECYEDKNDTGQAQKVAEEIVNSNAVAVIGHLASHTSEAASAIYNNKDKDKENKIPIPAISGSATSVKLTNENDWYFRTIFTNRFEGSFIANYLKKVLGFSKIFLIYEDTTYGNDLSKEIANELGGNIVANRPLEEKLEKDRPLNKLQQQRLTDLVQQLKDIGNAPVAVVLATGRPLAVDLIYEMKKQNLNLPLFGGDTLSDVAFAQSLAKINTEEKEKPGLYTNGIYAIAPVIFDVANDQGQQFRKRFKQKYGDEPGWIAASYYDAISAVGEAIKWAFKNSPKEAAFTGQNKKYDRELVKKGLASINSPDTAVKGGTRRFYFEATNTANAPIAVGRFNRGTLVSAFTQLQIIPNINLVSNLKEKIESGEILKIGNYDMQKTDIVYVGLDINDISYLDEKNSTCVVDFYLWFKYKGDVTVEEIEFSNYGINRLDSGETLSLKDKDIPIDSEPNIEPEKGVNHKIYRLKADFYEEFDFQKYPFDTQRLAVRFRHKNLTRDKLIYAIDLVGMQDFKQQNSEQSSLLKPSSSWKSKNLIFSQDTVVNKSTLGYNKFINTESNLEYSQFNAVVEIERDVLNFIIKNLLPLWFFMAVAYLFLFLPFEHLSVEALSGLLLAVVFYHLSLLDALPQGVGYVVALDYAFYVVYLLLGLELLLVTVGYTERFKSNQNKLILFGRVVFPVISLISFLVFYIRYFSGG